MRGNSATRVSRVGLLPGYFPGSPRERRGKPKHVLYYWEFEDTLRTFYSYEIGLPVANFECILECHAFHSDAPHLYERGLC